MLLSEKTIRRIIKENLLQSLLLEASLKDFKNPELNINEQSPLEIIEKKFNSILKNEKEDIDIDSNDPKYAAKISNLTKMYDISLWDNNSIARFFSDPLLEVFKEIKKSNKSDNEKINIINDVLDQLSYLYSKKEKGDVIYEQENEETEKGNELNKNTTIKELILFLKDKNIKNAKLQNMFYGLSIFKKIHKIHEDISNFFLSDYSDPSRLNKVKKTIIEKETEYLFGRNTYEGYKIVLPTTTQSSVFWARTNWKAEKIILPRQEDISWCTARYTGANMFHTYFVGGGTNLFYFLPEDDLEGKRKFCIGITKHKNDKGKISLHCGGHTSVNFENSPFLPANSDFNDPQTREKILSYLQIKNPKILDVMAEKMKEKDPFDQYKYTSEIGIDQFKALVHIKRDDDGNATNNKEVSGEIEKILGTYVKDEYQEKYKFNQKILNFIERSIFPEDSEGNIQIENSWIGPKNNLEIKDSYIKFFFPKKEQKHGENIKYLQFVVGYELYKKENKVQRLYTANKFENVINEKLILKFLNEKNDFLDRFEFLFVKGRNKVLESLEKEEIKSLLFNKVDNNINFILNLLIIDDRLKGNCNGFGFGFIKKSIFDFLPTNLYNIKDLFYFTQKGLLKNTEIQLIEEIIISDILKIEENKKIVIEKLKEWEKKSDFLRLARSLEENIDIYEIKDNDVSKTVLDLIENALNKPKSSDFGFWTMIYSEKIFKNYAVAKMLLSKGIDWFDEKLEESKLYNANEYKKGKIIYTFITKNETEIVKGKNKKAIDVLKVFLLRAKNDNKNIWEIFDISFLSSLRYRNNVTNPDDNSDLYIITLKLLAYYFQDITKIPKEIAKNHSDLIKYIIHFHPEQKKNLSFIKRMFHATKDAFSKEPTQREKEFFEEKRNRKNIVMTERQIRQFIRKNLI